jgi:hypothetical protein
MMPNRTRLLRRRVRYLAFVPIALLGMVGSSSAAIAAPVISPGRPVVLSGDSVGPVRFGEPQQKAAGALKKLIGATEGGVRDAKGNCTIDAALYWANFSVYFFKGMFVGYQTGNNLTGKPEPTFNGEDAAGPPRRGHLGRSAQALPRPRDNQRRERGRLRGQDDHRDDPWLSVARGLEPADKDPSRHHLGRGRRLPRNITGLDLLGLCGHSRRPTRKS